MREVGSVRPITDMISSGVSPVKRLAWISDGICDELFSWSVLMSEKGVYKLKNQSGWLATIVVDGKLIILVPEKSNGNA